MSKRALLLGEAPSRVGDRYYEFPLSGAVGRRLCQFAGIPPDCEEGTRPTYGDWYWALRDRFDCLNAIERFRDAYPWRVERARSRVRAYLEDEPTDTIVALGRNAIDAALGRPASAIPWFEWVEASERLVVAIPHPSMRCRTYNDQEMCRRAGEVLREAMDGAP